MYVHQVVLNNFIFDSKRQKDEENKQNTKMLA